MHMNYTTEITCTEQEHAQYIVYETYSRYSQIGKLYSPDLSMSVYIKKLWIVYQHNLAQSVLANNEPNILDSIDA